MQRGSGPGASGPRWIWPVAHAVIVIGVTTPCPGATPADGDLARYVDPMIGTGPSNAPDPVPGGAGGSTFPGVVAPFGMVQWSPDTDVASPSGYGYDGTRIEGFSVTHFNGAGCPNNEDLAILPIVGAVEPSPGADWRRFASPFTHDTELASPGRYDVTLAGADIRCELAATARTAMARFSFPPTREARVLINASRNATGYREGSLHIDGRRVEGVFTSGGFCGNDTPITFHYVIELDRAPNGYGTWLGDTVRESAAATAGKRSGAYLTFDTTSNPVVQMKVAISYVSLANAHLNLAEENPGWDIDEVRQRTRSAWNDVLGRIEVEGGTHEDRVELYTALYHVFCNPAVWNDVNGEYRGFDGDVRVADGWTNYQNYSGWDIIRSWTHLVAAIAPEGPDIIRSMVTAGEEAGLLPFWSDRNVETRVMVGDPGTINVANAYAMGVRGFDAASALRLMHRSASDTASTHRYGLADWLDVHHYHGNAAITLEYAMADFALSRFAGAQGDEALRDIYLARSGYWRESWNEADGFIEPRGNPGADAARIYEVEVYGPGAPGENLALHRPTSASDRCNENEGWEKAVNGSWDGGLADKWCDNASAIKWWQVDLGAVTAIDRIVVRHAGAGGESRSWNTRDFVLELGTDGETWAPVATVRGNRDDVTYHDVHASAARYVRLRLLPPDPDAPWGCQPFDPASGCGFIEGNGAQYVWMVPHDLGSLFAYMGGVDAAVTRLDMLFAELNAGIERPYFYIGNEPEHGTPWAYAFAGAPEKTTEVVRRIVDEVFHVGPGGLPGNDDLGATSAWLVWAYLGLYPAIPGTDVLVAHGPLLPAITVHLANGATLRIAREGDTGGTYVRGMAVDGTSTPRSWLHFAEISRGATLTFTMGEEPGERWGRAEVDRPPSFPPGS